MMIGSTAVAGRPSRPSGGRRSGPTTGAAEPIPPQGCEICEWARQCGSRVWECDACGRRRDFRAGAQLELHPPSQTTTTPQHMCAREHSRDHCFPYWGL